ncbi:MAG TPA: nuclear transport factor 2 family protein [Gaiellaceae bacterium]
MSDVVDRVVAALNERDLEAFVECYAADATIGDGREQIRATGHSELRALYGSMFARYPSLRVEPGWRTTVGEFVVQEETVMGRGAHERHVAIYLILDGVIARERLVA